MSLRPSAPLTEDGSCPSPLPDCRDAAHLGAWCVLVAGTLGLATLERRVRVAWNPRMRTTAGRAWWPDRLIELNPRLLSVSEEEVWRTVKHELAHLIAYERAGRRRISAHGMEWAQACSDLGIGGEPACHRLPFPRRRQRRRYHYTCPACTRCVKRAKPVKARVACYYCCKKFAAGCFDRRFQLIASLEE